MSRCIGYVRKIGCGRRDGWFVKFAPDERLRFVDARVVRDPAMYRIEVGFGQFEIGLRREQLHVLAL